MFVFALNSRRHFFILVWFICENKSEVIDSFPLDSLSVNFANGNEFFAMQFSIPKIDVSFFFFGSAKFTNLLYADG